MGQCDVHHNHFRLSRIHKQLRLFCNYSLPFSRSLSNGLTFAVGLYILFVIECPTERDKTSVIHNQELRRMHKRIMMTINKDQL